MKLQLVTILLFAFTLAAQAQLGGNKVYEFLSIPTSARAAALAGSALSINDQDISLIGQNPSLLNQGNHKQWGINYFNFMGGINMGQAAYAHHKESLGSFALVLNYMNGGKFIEADENGFQYGTFGVNQVALSLTYAKSFDSLFVIGAAFKPVFSQLASYNSFGILMDIGASYTSKDKSFVGTLVFQNMGSQISTYAGTYEPVPFNIQLSVSKKLAHAPFRLIFTGHNLQKPDLTYRQNNFIEPSNTNQENTSSSDASFAQKVFTHFIFGVEFLPTKNFFLRAGYNHMRRYELMLDSKPGISGFSWGFGFKIKKLNLSYAHAKYHLSGASNHLTISSKISNFMN